MAPTILNLLALLDGLSLVPKGRVRKRSWSDRIFGNTDTEDGLQKRRELATVEVSLADAFKMCFLGAGL